MPCATKKNIKYIRKIFFLAKKILLVLLFYISCTNFSLTMFANENKTPAKNFDILDSLFEVATNNIYKKYMQFQDTISYEIVGDNADWLLEKKLLEHKKNKILTHINNSKLNITKNILKIAIENISIDFKILENTTDSVSRNSNIKLYIINSNSNELPETELIEIFHIDTLHFDELIKVNKSNFGFATAKLPEKKRSYWERVFEPIIIITTAAITTFLFFSVRSK